MGGIERGERNLGFGNLLRIARGLDLQPSQLLAAYERLLGAMAPDAGGMDEVVEYVERNA
jgi:hypothetical protein